MKLSIETFAHLDSAALFNKVAHQPWALFLDSGIIDGKAPVSKHADFDVLAIQPDTTLLTQGNQTKIETGTVTELKSGDPLVHLQNALAVLGELDDETQDQQPAYLPGAIGYCAYDLARHYEHLPEIADDDEQLPVLAMGIYSSVVLVDRRAKTTSLISINKTPEQKRVNSQWRELIQAQINDQGGHDRRFDDKMVSGPMRENMTRQQYQACFDKIRQYTIDGDCYQVNLAKQFSATVSGDAWQTYRYLRHLSPAPYGAYMNFPFAQILSNSPESFIQCRDRHVVSSPIKGTRARNHNDKTRDALIADELYNSAKDRAENLMIVDLMRNDLSTCCELGTVKVPKLFAVHSFANVHHLISTVTGTLKQGLHSLDLLRKCFPGGSITGAPKIRAMEIIEELEPHRRGLYCGAVGYIGMNGDMETNIAIRTIVVKEGVARYFAGGGLVIDSDVDEEYQEVVDKAKMMTEALFD